MRIHFSRQMAAGAAALISVLLWTGCGNTFRPVVNPIAPPGGTPQALASVTVISQGVTIPSTGKCADGVTSAPCPGAVSLIDVGGDNDNTDAPTGRGPVHGFLSASGVVFTANFGTVISPSNTLSSFVPFASTTTTTITLPSGSNPVFVGGTESVQIYAALSGLNEIGVVTASPPALSSVISLESGAKPIALAETPNQQTLFVADSGTADVSVIQAASTTLTGTISLPSGAVPVWVTAKPDGSAIYVLDQALSQVYVIDPNIPPTIPPSNITVQTVAVGAQQAACPTDGRPCGFMYFDSQFQRLYVPNPGNNTISAFSAGFTSTGAPTLTPLALGCGTSCGFSNPIAMTAPSNTGKVYVLNAPTGAVGSVTVLDSNSLSVKTTITTGIGTDSRSIAASSDGTKVFVANNGPTATPADGTMSVPGTSVIATGSDTLVTTILAPFQNPTCTSDQFPNDCPRNAPVWVVGF
jgi:DNA-binding beta-propeller fold protein YncE